MTRIFDAHYHIDNNYEGCTFDAAHRNVIFNSVDQYKAKQQVVSSEDYKTLVFDFRNNLEFVINEIQEKKIHGLKIHSKIQQIADEDYETLFEKLKGVLPGNLVVTVDAFYSGHELKYQPNLNRIAEMAKLFPETPFVIAHSGGIKVLEYFMHLRTLPNIYFDLSFSLVYLKHASVMQDFKVLLKFGHPDKIIFGTDYPFISDGEQLRCFETLANDLNLAEETRNKILFENAFRLFHQTKK